MKFEEFVVSVKQDSKLPDGLSHALQALWHERRGEWREAHQLVQDATTPNDSWVHAYLHRVEGDADNASYWYARASKVKPTLLFEEEWEQIVKALLN